MNEPINDGGPAFPVQTVFHPATLEPVHTGQYWNGNGLSLRDWFAGMAVQGELAAQSVEIGQWANNNLEHLAKRCYAISDSMLAERLKGKP